MTLDFSRRSALAILAGGAATAAAGVRPQRPFVDGLSFLPENLSDVVDSGLTAFICDVSEVVEIKDAGGVPRYLRTFPENKIALAKAAERISNSKEVFLARKGTEIGSQPKCAAFLQFQSCEPVGDDLARIDQFYQDGLRILQFTHHNNNLFAGGCLEPVQTGLTQLGIEGLSEMNRLRILPDVAHGSELTMLEAAKLSKTPIIMSHGACKAIVDHPRCISDEAIRSIASRGGVVGIFMMSFWLTAAAVPLPEHFVAHINHVIKVGGVEAVGIANDFPMSGQINLRKLGNDNSLGVQEYLPWWKAMRDLGIPGFSSDPRHVVIPEFNNIDRLMLIERLLERARMPARVVDRIMGGNWIRVLTDTLG